MPNHNVNHAERRNSLELHVPHLRYTNNAAVPVKAAHMRNNTEVPTVE
jgi:hypothetical protein